MPRTPVLVVDVQVHAENGGNGGGGPALNIPNFHLGSGEMEQIQDCELTAEEGTTPVMLTYEVEASNLPGGIEVAFEHPGGDSWGPVLQFAHVGHHETRQFMTRVTRQPDFTGDHAFTVELYQITGE